MEENKYHFQVNLGGMLDILSNHLYRSADVFLRELLQNGQDAVTLRKKRQAGWNAGRMTIAVVSGKQLTFMDNGAGLNREEIHKFLAVLGQSSKNIQNNAMPQDYIGRFGIGLLSCFMVSDVITIYTRRAGDVQGFLWKGYPDGTYTLEELVECEEGTKIVLEAKQGAEVYFYREKLARLVRYYGLYLDTPVYFAGEPVPINEIPEFLRGNSRSQLLAFGEWIFDEEFMDAIPIHTEHLSGMAFILSYETAVTAKQQHRIYLKKMLLTEDGSTLLPQWAFFMRCVLDTNGLEPTASREDFYGNETLKKAQEEFAGAVKSYFMHLQTADSMRLRRIMSVHELAVKSLAIWDEELFDIFIDYLYFETSEGRLSGRAIRDVGEISYVRGTERFQQFQPIFRSQGRLLVCTGYTYDEELIQQMAAQNMVYAQPMLEEDVAWVLTELTVEERERTGSLARMAQQALQGMDCEVQLRRFFPQDIPALYAESEKVGFLRKIEQEKEERGIFSDALSVLFEDMQKKPLAMLYLNLNNPILQSLEEQQEEKLVESAVRILYIQAMLSGGYTLKKAEWTLFYQDMLTLLVH